MIYNCQGIVTTQCKETKLEGRNDVIYHVCDIKLPIHKSTNFLMKYLFILCFLLNFYIENLEGPQMDLKVHIVRKIMTKNFVKKTFMGKKIGSLMSRTRFENNVILFSDCRIKLRRNVSA